MLLSWLIGAPPTTLQAQPEDWVTVTPSAYEFSMTLTYTIASRWPGGRQAVNQRGGHLRGRAAPAGAGAPRTSWGGRATIPA